MLQPAQSVTQPVAMARSGSLPVSAAKLPRSLEQSAKTTLSTYEPHAQRVCLCGQFNQWSLDATPMKRQTDGHWEATVALAPGRYEYKFVVDGQWMPDLNAKEHVWNRYGTLNSVIEIQARE